MSPTLPPPYTKSIFLSTWSNLISLITFANCNQTPASSYINNKQLRPIHFNQCVYIYTCHMSVFERERESSKITSWVPSWRAASLNIFLWPELLPQKTHTLLNLPINYNILVSTSYLKLAIEFLHLRWIWMQTSCLITTIYSFCWISRRPSNNPIDLSPHTHI